MRRIRTKNCPDTVATLFRERDLECGAQATHADLAIVGRASRRDTNGRERWTQTAHANLALVSRFGGLGARCGESRAETAHANLAAVPYLRRRNLNLHCYLQLCPDAVNGVGDSSYAKGFEAQC